MTTNKETLIYNELSTHATEIKLYHQGIDHCINTDAMPFMIGRDIENCQLSIQSDYASRQHCKIEVKNNQIGLTDQSRNGTTVKIAGSDNIVIKDMFYPLTGEGCFSLNGTLNLDDPDLIHFKLR